MKSHSKKRSQQRNHLIDGGRSRLVTQVVHRAKALSDVSGPEIEFSMFGTACCPWGLAEKNTHTTILTMII